MEVANALAYDDMATIKALKSFYSIGPCNTFLSIIYAKIYSVGLT
jgi:hypothetical protein